MTIEQIRKMLNEEQNALYTDKELAEIIRKHEPKKRYVRYFEKIGCHASKRNEDRFKNDCLFATKLTDDELFNGDLKQSEWQRIGYPEAVRKFGKMNVMFARNRCTH